MKSRLSVAFSILIVLTLINTQVRGQLRFGPDERRIITLQDERRGVDTIAGYLSSQDIKTAWRAAIALGNIGDTTARPYLIARLRAEKRDTIADAIAFGLGLLGPSQAVSKALIDAIQDRPSIQKCIALARAAPKDDPKAAIKMANFCAEIPQIGRLGAAKTFVELALRKLSDPLMMDHLDELARDDNAEVRWRAAFAFARGGDSADLATRIVRLRELIGDQGSRNVRMFAALALGRVHNLQADSILWRGFRSEQDWQVRVNILNAMSRFPKFDTLIYSTFQAAVAASSIDSLPAINVGITAMQDLEQMIVAGKLSWRDSANVGRWVSEFDGVRGYNEEVAPIVAAWGTPASVRLRTESYKRAVQNYAEFHNLEIQNIASRSAGLIADTSYFKDLLESMLRATPIEMQARLEALDSMWTTAKRDSVFMRFITEQRTANAYRHMLIRISDLVPNPAIMSTALGQLQDSTILIDTTFRNEAERYYEGYLGKYNDTKHRDEMVSLLGAVKFLGSRSPAILSGVRAVYDSALNRSDAELLDSSISTLQALGQTVPSHGPLKGHTSHIDWNYLETMPPRIVVNLEKESFELALDPYYAPLTSMHMVKLAKSQYFVSQSVHRVVPNFVIQSGDPTGTGWGGPGYTIRTEISPLTYDSEGELGMASSGKDTEGSQWFITECPTPHLTTHYTIWGHVVSGMDLVKRVQQGDHIETFIPFR